MAKRKKRKTKNDVPVSKYPESPHIVGLDWVELGVSDPRGRAELYRAIGFKPRGTAGKTPLLGVGGTVFALKGVKRNGGRAAAEPMRIQLIVDNVKMKRAQLMKLGLKPSAIRREPRGDAAFEWSDADGHVIRFVGPVRRSDDEKLIK